MNTFIDLREKSIGRHEGARQELRSRREGTPLRRREPFPFSQRTDCDRHPGFLRSPPGWKSSEITTRRARQEAKVE